MSHAAHFLSRLDRVSRDHVELALSLYRDHELLRHVLSSVRLPDGADRVAISLDDPQDGPFLVITREGRFVTCLGRGMRPGDRPIVTRGQLDGITAKVTSFRARVEARNKLLGPDGEVGDLTKRILEAGPDLSREEFIAISSLQPLLAREFLGLLAELTIDATASRKLILRTLRRTDKLKPNNDPLLHAFWKQFWGLGHLAVLAAMGGVEPLGELPNANGYPSECIVSTATIRQGSLALAAKGAWAAAKIGRGALPFYKRMRTEATGVGTTIEAVVSLFAIGMRHSKLRAEVRKIFAKAPDPSSGTKKFASALDNLCETIYSDLAMAADYQRKVGQDVVSQLAKHFPEGSPYRFERPEDVPIGLGQSYVVNAQIDFWSDIEQVKTLLLFLPWVARAAPEELYLPAEFLKATSPPWKPKDTLNILQGLIELDKKRPPSAPEGPSRSGPCPCGSGKKYKRCCGDARKDR